MKNEELNQILLKALSSVTPEESCNCNLKRRMEEKEMEKRGRKVFSTKKVVLLAAACCLLIGSVSVAASGEIVSLISGYYSKEYTDFSALTAAENDAGFQVKAVESFRNGYAFSELSVTDTEGVDEEKNVLEHYRDMNFTYEKSGENELHIHTMEAVHAHENPERIPAKKIVIQGIQAEYYVDTYKWVPVDYELTEKDKENLKRSDYFISEGADSISENQIATLIWVQNGIRYSISDDTATVPTEILFSMAEELINTK